MTMIDCNGARLAYDEAGRGSAETPAVVFVHAGIADRRMWEHQFRALSANHRVIRYDWRGYGESGDAEGEFAHHEDLLALLDALEVARAVLVGCSMGGSYAVEAALTAPERVTGLVPICSGLGGHEWPPEMVAQARERVHGSVPADRLGAYRARSGPVDPADVEAMARAQVLWQVAGPDRGREDLAPEVWEAAVEMCRGVFARLWSGPASAERHLDPPAGDRLGEVRQPTLVINGLADVPGIQEVSDLLSAGIPGARRIDLPETGHLPPLERPAEVTAALTGFLSALR
ncbi:alpha/beta fold hydrolase [Planobispora longispora]|uniref:Alpha/beta hydrolase n=1 Tax=Planobispora longispora TaxID=28887 RepID=A0A8J3RPN7_9ACTN|nr:alpha/beta hydrolase [Planobispora longispora]BFE83953.1 alpha/beta hydrolase [Planobispora longispora]GIH78445.1 alpha/beta hydrolase [Planobispora longispora]